MTDLLAIETSAEAFSVALYCNGETTVSFQLAPRRHAELLLPAVRSLIEDAGLVLEDLDAIAFGQGPGSFTSLRIGIGAVQGLAWGAGLPVIPVSSLAAVAQYAAETAERDSFAARAICVAMDARMQEVYTANFLLQPDGFVVACTEERVCAPDRVEAPDAGPFIAAGNGFARFDELVPLAEGAARCLPECWPRADVVCGLALKWLEHNEPLPAALAQAVYVRNDVASKPAPKPSTA